MIKPHKLNAIDIQFQHHRAFLNLRNRNRIIQTEAFVEAWNQANEDQRTILLRMLWDSWADNCLNSTTSDKLKKWILEVIVGGLEQYSVGILRQIASYNRIKNYSRMTKAQLLSALKTKDVTNGSKNVK